MNKAPKLTKEQAIIIMGYTGVTTLPFNEFHKDVEDRFGRPIHTMEFGNMRMADQIREAYREDFLALLEGEDDEK